MPLFDNSYLKDEGVILFCGVNSMTMYKDAGVRFLAEKTSKIKFSVNTWREMASFDDPEGRLAISVNLPFFHATAFMPEGWI